MEKWNNMDAIRSAVVAARLDAENWEDCFAQTASVRSALQSPLFDRTPMQLEHRLGQRHDTPSLRASELSKSFWAP
jgi:hypothetical protein